MNNREPQRLDLTVVPGRSLGRFRLGVPIWDVINLLREQSRIIPSVDFKYSEELPLSTDLYLSFPANGIHLRFDAPSQRLKSIEIYDISKLRLIYQENEVSSNKVVPTFLLVYKIFGPTYPGEFDRTKKEYILNYPGVSFVFPIPGEHLSLFTSSTPSTDLPLELPDGTSPLLSRLYIFHGANFRSATVPPLVKSVNSDGTTSGGSEVGEVESVIATLKHSVIVNFLSSKTEILLHVTTPQDLLAEIGAPLRIFYKEEDKMRIHSEENTADDDENATTNNGAEERVREDGHPIDYFYNYFHMGFDVLFDGLTHLCKKIVLHGNVPGHYDFQRYKRCPYKIVVPNAPSASVSTQAAQIQVQDDDDEDAKQKIDQEKYITGEMKIDAINKLLGQPPSRPLIFNRGSSGQNPFGPTELNGFDGAVFEVMKNGHIATITLF